jgi:arsenate reductase
MAEAFLKKYGGDQIEAHSAGTDPKGVNPLTIRVMNEIGVDLEGHYSKSVKEFLGKKSPTHVFFVCSQAEQTCPRIWPFALHTESWALDDPASAEGSEEERLAAFREIRDQIDEKIRAWLANYSG